MAKLNTFVSLGTCLLLVMGPLGQQAGAEDQELDTERELKRMLTFVRPLMGILRSDERLRRSTDVLGASWVSRAIGKKERNGGYGYGGGGGGGGGDYGYGQSCCDEGHDYLALISLIALGLLFLFLIMLLSTTTASGRKKRSEEDNLLSMEDFFSQQNIGRVVYFHLSFVKSDMTSQGDQNAFTFYTLNLATT